MEIPKKIVKLLDKRERLACDLMSVSAQVDDWLAKNGADFGTPELRDSSLTGCMIYCEPGNARANVEDYIKNHM